jgi:hypothetical protein
MERNRKNVLDPGAILSDLVELDPGLGIEPYWGERSIFYNPGRAAPLGVIFASVKDHDGENDRSAELSRDGVYRFAFCMPPDAYAERFGATPARPAKGQVVDLADYDPTRIGELMPHPVYAWMRWVQILAPTASEFERLRPLLDESLELVRLRWRRRRA